MSVAPYPWQQVLWQSLIKAQSGGQMPQALLLSGPPGSGRSELARALSQRGLCASPADRACGRCGPCQQFAAGAHPDFLSIGVQEGKRDILIDQVRQFCAALQLTARGKAGRYGLIVAADQLTHAASNALLKTLEEPASQVTLILTAHRLSRLPATIRSRCLRLSLSMPSAEQAATWWAEQGAESPACEGLTIGPLEVQRQQQLGQLPPVKQWEQMLRELQRTGDAPASASQLDPNHLEPFLAWWQGRMVREFRDGVVSGAVLRLWEASLRARRQLGGNFDRLLTLEGLFILFLQSVPSREETPR